MNALDLLYIAAAGVTAPVWARKKRDGWRERFGHVGPMLTREPTGRPRVLLHAVSVGEAAALRTLAPLLAKDADVIVSVTTDTGLARARALYGEVCDVVRYPLDASWAVRRFLNHVRPDVVGLVELELWPNFLEACRRRKIPAAVINGRLSERSFKNYRRFKRVLMPLMFDRLEVVCVQDETYWDRFRELVALDRLHTTGSMKWDSVTVVEGEASDFSEEAWALRESMGIHRTRPVIVAGSTGPGEEALLHESCPEGVQLVCAPRKPERFDEAAAALPGCVRRSAGETREGDRFLLDTIGELSLAYEFADVVVIGRSFFDLYGSDPTEPAAMGKPVVIGPATSDFTQAVGVLREAGAIVETDRAGLAGVLDDLMGDCQRRIEMGCRARSTVREHQGASAKHADLLLYLCESGPRSTKEWGRTVL